MDTDQIVKIHKALGDNTRYNIVTVLAKGNCLCVGELGTNLDGIPLSTLSHHLKQLSDSGVLKSEKDGTHVYYRVNEEILRKYAPEIYDISIKSFKTEQ